MDELNQFLSSVEASARKIIKQQSKKAQESAIRERAELTRQSKQPASATASVSNSSGASSVSRDELRARYAPGGALIVGAGSSRADDARQPRSPTNGRRSEHDAPPSLPKLPPSPAKSGLAPPNQQTPPLTLPALDRTPKKQLATKPPTSPTRKNRARPRNCSSRRCTRRSRRRRRRPTRPTPSAAAAARAPCGRRCSRSTR